MATTILYNQKSTYGGPYCFYTVQYTEKSRSATAVTLGIIVQARLQYAASYNGYKLTGILTVGGTAFSIPIKGTETWSGTAVHTVNQDITVAASAGTTALSATFAVTNPSTSSSVLSTTGCSNISISRYYTAASMTAAGGQDRKQDKNHPYGKISAGGRPAISHTIFWGKRERWQAALRPLL